MPKVFIPQHPGFASVAKAEKFGILVECIDRKASPIKHCNTIRAEMLPHLKEITTDDFILLAGSHMFVAVAVATALEHVDSINFLQWHAQKGDYIVRTLE